MEKANTHHFQAELKIIGINPYVFVPKHILTFIFNQAGKEKSPIPVQGTINKKPFQQTLVRFAGAWRLYINLKMLKDSPRRIGETIDVSISYDPSERTFKPHPKLKEALENNQKASDEFHSLQPYLQKEIMRYIANLKTEKSVDRNVDRAIQFLLGKGSFIGREKI